MHHMTDEQHIQDIAAQLSHPQGQKGLDMAAMMHDTNIAMTLHSLDHLQLAAQHKILELGHGNCAHLAQLLMRKPALHYTGLEISSLMQQEAIRLNQAAIDNQQADFQTYDGTHLHFAAAQFDRIFTVNTLYFWQQPLQLLTQLYQVLKPQGIFNLTFADKSFMQQLPFTKYQFQLYDIEQLKQLIAQTNFRIEAHYTAQDRVKNKLGVWVERSFSTLCLSK